MTATSRQFFAAERIIAGPPMSICSIGLFERDALARDRLLERVEVDDDEVNRLDAVLAHGRDVLVVVAQGQQAAVNPRVQAS